MEADLANGKKIDITKHALLVSSMVRVATRIGINRRLKEVVPSLGEYLENAAPAEDEDEDDIEKLAAEIEQEPGE